MKLNRRWKNQIINFFSFGAVIGLMSLCMTIYSTVENIKKSSNEAIEQHWREEARGKLNYLKDMYLEEEAKGLVNSYNEASVQEWFRVHLQNMRNGSPTSDGFVIEMGTETFLYDSSADCALPVGSDAKTIKDNIPMHKYPKTAEKAYNSMRELQDTKLGNNYFWQFNVEPEWLEWVMIPKDRTGFKGEPSTIGGTKNKKYRGFLVQLGTQENEIIKQYEKSYLLFDTLKYLVIMLAVIVFLLTIFNLSIMIMTQNEECKEEGD